MRELRVRFGLSLLAAALFALFCLTPMSAQNAATTVNVDAGTINVNSLPNGAIDPRIYGIGMIGNDCDADTANLTALNSPTHRWGGDLTSTFNWQLDSWNLSNDWYWEVFTIGAGEGACVDEFVSNTQAAGVGTEPIITVPMLPWISNSLSAAKYPESFDTRIYGAQVAVPACVGADMSQGATDPDNNTTYVDAGTGIVSAAVTGNCSVAYTYVTGNNPADDYVQNSAAVQQAWVQHLVTKFGGSTAANGVKYYMLDNEVSDWAGTHRDVHPQSETYDEAWADIKAYAGAIKTADPSAIVVGPEEWGWWPMFVSGKDQAGGTGAGSDYATHGNMYYYPWLLSQLAAYKKANGTSLIDILTVHCYDDNYSDPNQATRELWDTTYTDPNGWYGDGGQNGGKVNYIPLMRNWVAAAFPNGDGPLVGCTEYTNWGGASDQTMTGATVEADALGIFGAFGFSLGNYWTLPAKPTYLSMQIYRNYDGRNSTFGDTSVTDTVVQPDNLSSFAAVRKSDGALTVMVINKQTGTTPVTINLKNFSSGGTSQAYQISSNNQTSINSLGSKTVSNNAISDLLPGPSVTLYVIPAVTVAPTAPTGLTAAGGNALVTLNWTGSTGATSYNVYRGTTAGGESSTAIATNVTAVTYVDGTVTNGQIYYYTVKAVNSIGMSAASNEASATPSASAPLFTATATASPNPATQNASTTLTVKVTCTQNTMTGGSVSIVVLDPSGNVAQTTLEASQSFTNGLVLTYFPTITPTVVGTYTVQVNVSGPSGQLFTEIPAAGTFTVNAASPPAAPSFSITGGASPTSISATGSATISATFTNNGGALTNGNLELQVYNGSTVIGGIAPNYNANNIAAGASTTLTFTWTPSTQSPAFTTPGTYDIVGLAWSNNYGQEYTQTTVGTVTIQAAATTAPAAPTGLTATAGNASVGLSWAVSSGATSYSVYRGTTAGGESSTAIATGLTVLAYTDSSVANGQIYYYEVAAVNSVGTSSMSNEASATPSSSAPTMPATPTNLKAQAANDSVALTWTSSTNATSFNVYRGTATGMEGTTPLATNITGTTYTDSSATNGTTYYYEVAAVNGAETSGMSNEVSATPSSSPQFTLTATANPLSIVTNQSTDITATVTCTANCSANVLANATVVVTVWIGGVRTPSTYPSQNFNTAPTQIYNNVPAGATEDIGQYYIEIDVEDAVGNVLATNPTAGYFMVGTDLAFLSPATATPASITANGNSTVNFSITDVGTGGLLDMDVEIQMEDSAGNVVSGQIYPGQSFQPNATAQTYTYNWTPSALTPPVTAIGVYTAVITINNPQAPWYTNYYTSPVATDATVTIVAGKSTGAAFASVTTSSPNPVVVGNSTVIISTITDVGQAGLTNGTAKIYVIPPGGTLASPAKTISCTALNFTTSSGASPSQNCLLDWSVGSAAAPGVYTVEIGVYDSTGTTNYYWNPQALLITVGAPPATPTGLTATGGNARVTLNWTASNGATSYSVYRGTTPSGESTTPIITGITGTIFTDTTVTNGTTYYYKVAAVNSEGVSTLSNEASATPEPPTPSAPIGLTATAGNASVALSWTAADGNTSYNIYRGTTAGGESTTAIATGIATASYTDSGLTNGTTYYYEVASVNASGTSGMSNEASATPKAPVSPTFTLSATTPGAISAGSSATSTVTVSTTTGYVGAVTIGCAVTASPAGASLLPTCSASSSTVTLGSGVTTGTELVTITTTGFSGELLTPKTGGNGRGWAGAEAVLAFLVFLGIPARRRKWRAMLGLLLMMAALGTLSACGGNISRSGTNGQTSSGSYTFTVTGTGNPAVTPAPTTTFALTVK
jgi:fibronectin type 3 domain-containing protein